MATTLSSSILSLSPSSSSLGLRRSHNNPSLSSSFSLFRTNPTFKIRQLITNNKVVVVASSSSSSFDDLSSDKEDDNFTSKKSVLLKLIQEIEPLDVSIIQKDVPPTTLDAMKRTISGMLGLLPSDRFQVLIEALWEPLSKLLVSSMMTGYTLRNAEYRLSLEKNFGLNEGSTETLLTAKLEVPRKSNNLFDEDEMISGSSDHMSEAIGAQDLGEITPEAQQYILKLKSSLSFVQKELCEVRRKSAALQMQQFVGEEKNDLLDYLRSLQPEKVAELSEPTCPELKEAVYSVIHGLLATLSTKMHSRAPMSENTPNGSVNVETEEDHFDVIENASLPYQPLISLTRDYLARLLFWCMMLGHYLRGLEYRMELTELLSLPINVENYPLDDELAA